ncbi:MAG: ornithine carbamoyltransferase [Candidatus Aminicenantes bacterium]|nr:ornithine carbamoyltransferase [Candidatus Aminicenantes bacterium]
MQKDFISIHDLTLYEFNELLDLTQEIKEDPDKYRKKLKNKILAMIFEKPSLRTRMTFEVGMFELGGKAVYLSPNEIQVGKRETVEDIGHNLERWVDGIMIRTFAHDNVIRLAKSASIPVINALTDFSHPCQGMADIFTLREKKGGLSKIKLAYVGDGNNVCHSLMLAAAKAGLKMAVATPKGYEPSSAVMEWAREDGRETGFTLELVLDPKAAVKDADAVYTDTWASMGQEQEKEARARVFAPFQVNPALMAFAKLDAAFMHCLPAHREEEVTASVLESPQSVVFDQAENRLHIQKAIMLLLMGKKEKHGER